MDETEFIPTRCSALKRKPNDFEVVSFTAYKSKGKKKAVLMEPEEVTDSGQATDINMKRARYEILKFGMTGFDAERKEEAKVQLAIKLGAKPPKKQYKNYKLLLEDKKKEKTKKDSKLALQQLGKNSVGKSTAKGKSFDKKRKMKSKSGDILDIYGTVKTADLKKDNMTKKKKR